MKLSGSITAAATTGPARQPRPASSVPASSTPGIEHAGRGLCKRGMVDDVFYEVEGLDVLARHLYVFVVGIGTV